MAKLAISIIGILSVDLVVLMCFVFLLLAFSGCPRDLGTKSSTSRSRAF